MTIEQKAKAYDEALERARSLQHDNGWVTTIFPELKESEDERIKKEIISFIEYADCRGIIPRRCLQAKHPFVWIDYLEKQKEQNGEDEEANDFTIYHPLKNGKDKYECIPYSFYGSLTSFSEDKDLIDFLRTCFYTEEECNEWIEQQKEPENVSATTMIPSCWTEKQKKQEPIEPELKTPDWVHGGWDNEYMINTVIGRYSLHAEVAKKRGDTHDYNLSKSMENWLRNVAKPLILDKPKEQKPAEWSEDERIRKFLIWIVNNIIGNSKGLTLSKEKTRELIRNYDGIKISDVLAYLEMQKEQKPVKFNDDTEVGLDRALQIVKKAKGNLCGYQSDDGIYECDHAIQTLEHILKNGIEQKSAEWSKEDAEMVNAIIDAIPEDFAASDYKEMVDWLKSLPKRFNPQPKNDWSEEDKDKLYRIIEILLADKEVARQENPQHDDVLGKAYYELISWLKALRPQSKQELRLEVPLGYDNDMNPIYRPINHWRPSEEQMRVLLKATPVNLMPEELRVYHSLYNDLQKL